MHSLSFFLWNVVQSLFQSLQVKNDNLWNFISIWHSNEWISTPEYQKSWLDIFTYIYYVPAQLASQSLPIWESPYKSSMLNSKEVDFFNVLFIKAHILLSQIQLYKNRHIFLSHLLCSISTCFSITRHL